MEYWEDNGGLAQFGYPITEESVEGLIPGADMIRVQYFERARFEYHPQNDRPYDVLLGQFGRQIMAENALLSGSFGYLYITNADVRERLGSPTAEERQIPGVTQEFERGRMFYLGDTRAIYVLSGTQQAGALLTNSPIWDRPQGAVMCYFLSNS